MDVARAERSGDRCPPPPEPHLGSARRQRRDAQAHDGRDGLVPSRRPLPGGVQAFPTVLPGEVVFWLPEQRALVPADVIDGVQGGLCLLPDSWLAEGVTSEAQRESLLPLLELPIDMVLVSHGEPILVDGHAALARALGA